MSNVPGPWEEERAKWQKSYMAQWKLADSKRAESLKVIDEISNICDMLENYLAQHGAYQGPIEAVAVLRVQVRKLLENVHRSE